MNNSIEILVPVFRDLRIKRLLKSRNEAEGKELAKFIIWDGSEDQNLKTECSDLLQKEDNWICKGDKGIFDAFNQLLRVSESPIVVMMGADDYFGEKFDFEEVLYQFNNKGVSIVFPRIEYFKGIHITRRVTYRKYTSRSFYLGIPAYHCGTFFNKNAIKGNYFDTKFPTCADYGFFARLFKNEQEVGLSKQLIRLESGGASGSWKARVTAFVHMNKQLQVNVALRILHFLVRYIFKIKSII